MILHDGQRTSAKFDTDDGEWYYITQERPCVITDNDGGEGQLRQ
jgi:hypothetical protein